MCSLMLTYCPICIKKKQTIKPAEPLNQYWSTTHQKFVWSLDIKMWVFLSHRTHLLIVVAPLYGIVLFPFSLCKGIIDGEGEKRKESAIHVGFPINLIG